MLLLLGIIVSISKTNFHYFYLYSVGIAGWLWVSYTFLQSNHLANNQELFQSLLGSFIVLFFFALAIIARFTSFRLTGTMEIAIDSAFYLASTAIIGSQLTAVMALICMTFDSFRKIIFDTFRDKKQKQPIVFLIGNTIFNGGLTSLGILACGNWFGFDSHFLSSQKSESPLWLLPIMSMVLLSGHYILSAIHLWLGGMSLSEVFQNVVIKGIFYEIFLVPLALVMVLSFDPKRPIVIILLGITYIIFAMIVKWLSNVKIELQQNLHTLEETKYELQTNNATLETINRVGNSINENLEIKELLKVIATETISLIHKTSLFLIGTWNENVQRVHCTVFDGNGKELESKDLKWGEGLTGYVMSSREGLILNEVQTQKQGFQLPEEFDDPSIHSWVGLPLINQDEVIGVINLQSDQKNAYSESDIRLLKGLAQQAAVAIKNARLYELATVEGLTGLYVRRYFDIRLQEEWHRSQRYDSNFSVVLLDLDNFKKINDQFGHPTGDKILKTVGQIVKANMRTIDIPARYGGEEFAMILPKTTNENAFKAAERIRKDIESAEILFQGNMFRISGSFGVASYPESEAMSSFELVDRADKALYQAKRLGKNRVETFSIHSSFTKIDAVSQ